MAPSFSRGRHTAPSAYALGAGEILHIRTRKGGVESLSHSSPHRQIHIAVPCSVACVFQKDGVGGVAEVAVDVVVVFVPS